MERSNKHRSKRNHKVKKAPKVPIKTYRWEDIRRARRRGGYPWTHLYKGPFTEKVDPDQFTMDALRRTKSSPMSRRSDRIEISEVSSWADYSGKSTPTLLHELINDPQEDATTKNSRPGSVVIEEYVEEEDKDLEDDVQVKEFQIESAESSDNISQYLDKEEQGSAASKIGGVGKTPAGDSKDDISDIEERARSEEITKRKRKISGESGHSRYSLSKLGVIKKLQDAKNKIKIPKLSFPTKKIVRKRTSPPKEEKPKKETKKNAKKISESSRPRKSSKPVYIHIPLKPPPGEIDEFSHLEFETKQNNETIEEPKSDVPEVMSEPIEEKKEETNDIATKKDESPFSTLERGPRVTKKPPLQINPAFKQFLKDVRQLKDKEPAENESDSGAEQNTNKDSSSKQELVVEPPKPENDEILDLEERELSDSESPKNDVFDKLFEASGSKKEDEERADEVQPGPSVLSAPRNVRSQSAEPQNKRRSSMDSSYSRKSLSKLAIMKKIKDASEKIKSAFSMDSLRKKFSKKDDPVKEIQKEEKPKKPKLTSVVKPGQLDKPIKNVAPMYIHIPLKPPEGQTDEFSYLANETASTVNLPEAKKDERTDSLDSTSPKTGDIQFIFLTPPSDDEILDKESDIPETPSSSDDIVFFSSLKKLAQDVVDQVSPETKNNTLETVSEESDKSSSVDVEVEDAKQTISEDQGQPILVEDIFELEGNVIVDVEDGLSETPKTEEQLKSALKTTETSANAKRVSFKRKSKTPKDKDKGSEYELIEPPKEKQITDLPSEVDQEANDDSTKQLGLLEKLESEESTLTSDVNQSLSVDEEKGYLEQKIIKDTSLEEDYNKWSNAASDHEYELISPIDEVTVMKSSELPNVTVITDGDTDPKVVISATEILDKPLEEHKRKAFFQFGGMFHKGEREKSQERRESSDAQSRGSSQGKELPAESHSTEPNKFQVAFKQRTEQLKTKTNELRNKIHNIKKPNIHLPKTPEFKKPQFKRPDFKQRFKLEKPKINFHLPKIPDKATIHLPHISLPGARKTTETRTVETRQFSTESTAGDSDRQTKRHKFDLSFGGTFPRFRKAKKPDQEVVFATVPRVKNGKQKKGGAASSESSSIRVPLHSEDSTDPTETLEFEEETEYDDRETSADIARIGSTRISGDVAVEDEYERENQAINRADYLSRWQRGNFKERQDDADNEEERIVEQLVEQRFGRSGQDRYDGQGVRAETLEERLRRDEERPRYIEEEDEEEFDIRLVQNKHLVTDLDNLEDDHVGAVKDEYSSEGSCSLHRKGRLGKLDVDSDEFFVVHEIREGFQTPANALAQMNEYDPIGSNRSLPTQMLEPQPTLAERKPIKKPKRKKTPHVSREEIPGDEESIEGLATPSRPKRRSKRNKKKTEKDETIVPYQETIPLDSGALRTQRLDFPRESLGILGDDEGDDQEFESYESERAQTRSYPDPYKQFQTDERRFSEEDEDQWSVNKQNEPSAPPRKHRSLKSLNQSESDSITDIANIDDQIIQTVAPPRRPSRRSRSHTSSLSRMSLPPSLRDTDSVVTDEGYLADNQQIPSYLIENQSYKKQHRALPEASPCLPEDQERQPCVEEPCVQDLRDYMGYSIVDKTKQREPPLPPPRTPPRRRKRAIEEEEKFATVPRNIGLSQGPPVRPLRNYSTLSHVKSSRKDSSPYENDKENIENPAQYIEIDDEVSKDLVSGEVVQKMRQRPLPAPPRPPRKPKTTRKSLQDITSKENIIFASTEAKTPQEETVSTQTEPLPPDFICEEIQQEPSDTIITPRFKGPTRNSDISEPKTDSPVQRFEIYDPRTQAAEREPRIRRELITPSVYSFEETVTHGTLLVQPIEGAKVIPDHQLSKERLVPITRALSDETDETSEVPESFKLLRNPQDSRGDRSEHSLGKVDKLQVSDLDVDRLTVNQLLASKIVVSEIDTSTISANEIEGKQGTIKLGDIELPPQLLEQLLKQRESREEGKPSEEQKKTPIVDYPSQLEHPREVVESEISAPITLSRIERLHQESDALQSLDHSGLPEDSVESTLDFQRHDLSPEPPVPPPRGYTLEDSVPDAPPRTLRRKSKQDSPSSITENPAPVHNSEAFDPLRMEILEPDVDDQPPPRPPEPLEGLYFPSQPPASFYALRAKQFVDENIPTAPRRKRHHSGRSRPVSRSHSTSDDSTPHRTSRILRRFSEPSIPELSGRLIRACGSRINNALKRLIYHLTENLLRNADGKQDLHVFLVILLVLIAGLILLGYGEERTVVHLHHWEYFNPPKDL